MPGVEHRSQKGLNNRAANSHQLIRRQCLASEIGRRATPALMADPVGPSYPFGGNVSPELKRNNIVGWWLHASECGFGQMIVPWYNTATIREQTSPRSPRSSRFFV